MRHDRGPNAAEKAAIPVKIQPGVESLTITDATPGASISLLGSDDQPLVKVIADESGNAYISYLPCELRTVRDLDDLAEVVADGLLLERGNYTVVEDSTGERHGPVEVLGVDDHPDPSLYDQTFDAGFGYLTVRDGVQLSIMVRFPNEGIFGPPPWPTVVEYSGYGPSNPDSGPPGSLIANMLGFATVGVNMRGSGCSGGVFDLFSPAQSADGYDVIETVARQSWVAHGRPGMVGLSYPGNSQLFVAATQPPSLAAITPLSVLDDLWRQQWPGGTYNAGFTRAWLAQRDAETQKGGMSWDAERIDGGDEVCATNQSIRSLGMDFEKFGLAMENFKPAMDARRAANLVHKIQVPVYLTGSWQDEQTGSRFALMIDRFDSAPNAVFTVFNGHHADGYSPMVISRWFEFLSFYVARKVPVVHPLVRQLAPSQFAKEFDYVHEIEEDRFGDLVDDFDAALARYESEPRVRILFESGTGSDVAGAPAHGYEATSESFPPPDVEARRWWLDNGGKLVDARPDEGGADRYSDDIEAGEVKYAQVDVFDAFIKPTVPVDWSHFDEGASAAYEVELDEALTIVGQGHLDLWLRPGTPDTSVQVTLTEVRPDGMELRVQSGWHRLVHAGEDAQRSDELRVDYTFSEDDRSPLDVGEWHRRRIPLMPFAHVFRAGSKIRIRVSTPGRDTPLWLFGNPVTEGASHDVGRGGEHASSLLLPVWPQSVGHPAEHPPSDALRGQPARPARAISNIELDPASA